MFKLYISMPGGDFCFDHPSMKSAVIEADGILAAYHDAYCCIYYSGDKVWESSN
jgi:hypothetical protein